MKPRRCLSILLVFVLVVSFFSTLNDAYATKTRSAEKVLEDIISVKQQWERTTSQSKRNTLHDEAEALRRELKKTKEYLDNIKVSSRNFTVEKGKDPGFRDIVLILCMPPNDTIFNVQTALKYVKAYNKSFWGQVCIVSGGIIFVGALVYGAVTYGGTVIATVGMTAAKWKVAVSTAISNISTQKILHVLTGSKGSNHQWALLTKNVNWQSVQVFIQRTLLYGENITIKGYPAKQYVINGYTVIVKYFLQGSKIIIEDAWVM
jgi:hypothetical protein